MNKIIILILIAFSILIYGCAQVSDEQTCSFNRASLNLENAKSIAQEYCKEGTLTENSFCNENTGTWWIDFQPKEVKTGCNPACVVNVETKTAEINWRCTGYLGPPIKDVMLACENLNGNWIVDFNECEYISQEDCSNLGGTYDECASACRNDPKAEICTMQCVQVCSFD